MKKNIANVLFVLAAGLFVWWLASGHQTWTTTQQMVDVVSKDEVFGETHTTLWKDEFTPGLELIGPVIAIIAGAGWFLLRSKKRVLADETSK